MEQLFGVKIHPSRLLQISIAVTIFQAASLAARPKFHVEITIGLAPRTGLPVSGVEASMPVPTADSLMNSLLEVMDEKLNLKLQIFIQRWNVFWFLVWGIKIERDKVTEHEDARQRVIQSRIARAGLSY